MIQVARKVVGVGSVGTRAWIVLMEAGDGIEPLFLQAKEAQPSVLAEYCGRSQYQQRRRAGRRRAAPDAGPKRHLPRLDPRHRRGRGRARLLRAPAAGLEILHADRTDGARRADRLRPAVRLDPGPGARPLRRPRRAGRLPGRLRPNSTRPSPSSPKPTPTRTNATTPRSKPRSKTAKPKPPPRSKDREVMAAANRRPGLAPRRRSDPRSSGKTASRSMNSEDQQEDSSRPRDHTSRWWRSWPTYAQSVSGCQRSHDCAWGSRTPRSCCRPPAKRHGAKWRTRLGRSNRQDRARSCSCSTAHSTTAALAPSHPCRPRLPSSPGIWTSQVEARRVETAATLRSCGPAGSTAAGADDDG